MINDRKFTVLLLDMINDIRIEPLEAESELKSYSQSYKKKRYILFLRTITRRIIFLLFFPVFSDGDQVERLDTGAPPLRRRSEFSK